MIVDFPNKKVGGAGFEPAKAEPTDLQSVPFDRSGNPPVQHLKHFWCLLPTSKKSLWRGSNPRPTVYKTVALPTELQRLISYSEVS